MTRRAARLTAAVLLLVVFLHGWGCSPGPCRDRRLPVLPCAPPATPSDCLTVPSTLAPAWAARSVVESVPPAPVGPAGASEPAVAAVWETLAMPAREVSVEEAVLAVKRVGLVASAGGPAAWLADAAEQRLRGHGPDYQWIAGRLHYAQVRGVWCLRYAGEDAEDPYGGRVTLVGLADLAALAALRDGELVRVEGRLVDPASREAPAESAGPTPPAMDAL